MHPFQFVLYIRDIKQHNGSTEKCMTHFIFVTGGLTSVQGTPDNQAMEVGVCFLLLGKEKVAKCDY